MGLRVGPLQGLTEVHITVPFSASDYGATGGGSWTVTSADVNFSYIQIGNFLHFDLIATGGVVAGNPPALTLRLPFVINDQSVGTLVRDPTGNPSSGFVVIQSGTQLASLFLNSGIWTNGVTPLGFEISLSR